MIPGADDQTNPVAGIPYPVTWRRVMSPVRVAVIDPHELVVAGATALLSRFPERVQLVDWPDGPEVDVVLYSVDDESGAGHDARLHALLRSSPATVVAFGWNQDGPEALLASACGVHGFAHKQLPAAQLVVCLELLHRARSYVQEPDLPDDGQCDQAVETAGLSGREMEVLSMIASGRTNGEIAEDLFLSVNSVKTYIRAAYRKIGVSRRSQAVIWARNHGLGTSLVHEVEPRTLVDAAGA